MRPRLFIRLRSPDPETVQWVHVDASGTIAAVEEGTLQEAAAAGAGSEVIVLVPGDRVVLCAAAVPSRNRQRIAEALPFALEEQLIDDVDDLHFAVGERGADGRIHTAVVAREHMDAWLETLHGAGVRPEALVPDILAVPYTPGQWTLASEADITLLRTGLQSGYAFDTPNTAAMLPAALASAAEQPPEGLRVIPVTEGVQVELPELGADVPVEMEGRPASLLEVLAGGYGAGSIDLLQGDYSRQEQLGKLWRPWRPAAALLLVWLCIQAGVSVVEYSHLKHQATALQQDVAQTIRRAFPEVRNIVNPKVQMQRKLEALRGGGQTSKAGFINLLTDIGPQLITEGSLQLKRLSFSKGRFDLAITIGDLQKLDALKQRLAKNKDFSVNIQSATSTAGGVEARLQIRVKAS